MIENEDYNIEYKEDISEHKDGFKAEIVSFLNSGDGIIYLGVKDDGTPLDYNDSERRKLYKEWEEKISNWIATSFNHSVSDLILVEPNSTPFKVTIKEGKDKPYCYSPNLDANKVYVRVGSTKRKASQEEIIRMVRNYGSTETYDKIESSNQNLNFNYVKSKFDESSVDFDDVRLNLKEKNNSLYNNAAYILSNQNPYVAKVALFKGTNTNEFKDKKEFSGSIVKQIDDVLEYLNLSNTNNIKITEEGQRQEKFDYPQVALREAVINAFVHRDYSYSADIRIELYSNRIEISSPGSTYDGLTVEDIKEGCNARRNPVIVRVLDKIKYMENYGTGVRRIFDEYRGFKKEPILKISNNQFKIILYNKNSDLNKLSEDQLKITEYLFDNEKAPRSELQIKLKKGKSATINIINDMKKKKILKSDGNGSQVVYMLDENFADRNYNL